MRMMVLRISLRSARAGVMLAALGLFLVPSVAGGGSSPAAAQPPQPNQPQLHQPSFPFAYDWDKFPAAWFAANAKYWEDSEQIAEIGKYAMAILGWQHLAATTQWEAIVYTQLEQAAIIKKAHPGMPVFVYSGFGFAAGFNNGTWPALQSVLKDPKGSPYREDAEVLERCAKNLIIDLEGKIHRVGPKFAS